MTSRVGLLDLEVVGRDLGIRHRGRPDDGGRPSSISRPAPTTPPARTDQVAGLEVLMDGRQDPLGVAQVGAPANSGRDRKGHRARAASEMPGEGLDRVEALGAAHGDPDGHA
jgi:hypothetical protein